MRRVLVPLDGTAFAASVLPDACRLAGDGGTLVLISEMSSAALDLRAEGAIGEEYLAGIAERLRDTGCTVETHAEVLADPAVAIATAAELYRADLIACASHGRGTLGRLIHGSIAWRALAVSPIPVMVRHPAADEQCTNPGQPRRIMVPLDGSRYAERALGLALALAVEWHAPLILAHVIPGSPIFDEAYVAHFFEGEGGERRTTGPNAYLHWIAGTLPVPVERIVVQGGVVAELRRLAADGGVTDIVISSHGRTGLARAIYGSVTGGLVRHLHIPILVVPSHVHARSRAAVSEQVEPHRFRLAVPHGITGSPA